MNTQLKSQVIPLKSTMSDNWFYLLVSGDSCVLVDPVDSIVAIEAVRSRGLELSAVVNTHWHPDHVAGDDDVCNAFPNAELLVAAGDQEKIAGLISTKATGLLKHGDSVKVGDSAWTVIATPGHTHGHISLQLGADFLCGDTLFASGAGHCRSGDPKVLFNTYEKVIRLLPAETQFYPGHDYAVRNLEFALSIQDAEPARGALEKARDVVGFRRVVLNDEKLVNPFLRVWEPAYQDIVRSHAPEVWKAWSQRTTSSEETAFCALRELRNSW